MFAVGIEYWLASVFLLPYPGLTELILPIEATYSPTLACCSEFSHPQLISSPFEYPTAAMSEHLGLVSSELCGWWPSKEQVEADLVPWWLDLDREGGGG